MSKKEQILYEFGDINRLKRHLSAGKKVIFTDLGTFHLEYDKSFHPQQYEPDDPPRYIKFEADSELKNVIWEVLYYGVDRKTRDCTDIANQLISMNAIELVNFGKIYIQFDPGYYKWHDFHGKTWVDPKPRIKFLKHNDFNLVENTEKSTEDLAGL